MRISFARFASPSHILLHTALRPSVHQTRLVPTRVLSRTMSTEAPAELVNVLAKAKSPYLLQHKDNPVAWQEFTPATVTLGQSLNRPIFLSSGYSACHWCHVLAHESFEDPGVAEIMNKYFVNIKVDREERPDVDKLYMTYLQMTQGGGGWPLSVFLTPKLEPFFAGTYFPRAQFKGLLIRVQELWEDDQSKCEEMGARVIGMLRTMSVEDEPTALEQIDPPALLDKILVHLLKTHDPRYGGFSPSGPRSTGPKFPSCSLTLEPLLRLASLPSPPRSEADNDESGGVTLDGREEAVKMGVAMLRAIWKGGIRDWVGGGVARYSVDERWIVPHFEKMLYDQAQLCSAALDFARLPTISPTDRNLCISLASDILTYVLRDLLSPLGGFYSAEDADSAPSSGAHKREGAFYVWDKKEVDEVVQDADVVGWFFGIKVGGNVDPRHDSHGEMTGKNILYQAHSAEETAAKFGISPNEVECKVAAACAELKKHRDATRERPGLDDKILTSWNGLMLSALAKASVAIPDPEFAQRCQTAAEGIVAFVRKEMWDSSSRTLYRSFRDGRGPFGQTEDYAFLIQGLLDLYTSTGDDSLISLAVTLQTRQDELFWDDQGKGYFSSAPDPHVLVRLKDDQDGAEPCATSISLRNLARLELLVGSGKGEEYAERFGETVKAVQGQVEKVPFALGAAVSALVDKHRGYREFIVTGPTEGAEPILASIHASYAPNTIVIRVDPANPPEALAQLNPVVKALIDKGMAEPGLRVCENGSCALPVSDSDEVKKVLSAK